MPELGLKENELSEIVHALSCNPLILSATIFGSRAIGSHKPYSDIDIAVYGDLDASDVEGIINDLDELPLIYKFDIVAYGLLNSPALREHITNVGINIFDRKRRT
jgi:predicted nucleotidyltransferase